MDMEFNLELIMYAMEKYQENSMWELYKMQYVNMDKENFENFEDYKAKFKYKSNSKANSEISYEEIEEEMKKVEMLFQKGGK